MVLFLPVIWTSIAPIFMSANSLQLTIQYLEKQIKI